jgi:hypothetical protein
MTTLARLKVSSNHHFLVTESDRPFFWLGDTAWSLFHRMTREEIEAYYADRQRKQFNVIQVVVLIEQDGLNTPNVYGERPLLDNDPTRPNEDYFRRLDDYIALAEKYGLYICLLPTWGDKVTVGWIWGVGPIIFNRRTARAYGRWIAKRYRNQKNIIWCMGGDRPLYKDKNNWLPIWRSMAAGIRGVLGTRALLTYHPDGGLDSPSTIHAEDWSDFVMIQSGHWARETPGWEWIEALYHLTPPKPALDGEPNYEDHPAAPWPTWDPANGYFRDYEVRKQTYRTVFAGGCGVTYGHHSIWQCYTSRSEPINHPYCYWDEALDRPAAGQMCYLRQLIESRPCLDRVPDQSLLADVPTGRHEHPRAFRDNAGDYAMIYRPVYAQFVVKTGALNGGRLRAWWYNPRTGAASEIGIFDRQPEMTFTTPVDGPDWVLVLDNAARDFPKPGQSF